MVTAGLRMRHSRWSIQRWAGKSERHSGPILLDIMDFYEFISVYDVRDVLAVYVFSPHFSNDSAESLAEVIQELRFGRSVHRLR